MNRPKNPDGVRGVIIKFHEDGIVDSCRESERGHSWVIEIFLRNMKFEKERDDDFPWEEEEEEKNESSDPISPRVDNCDSAKGDADSIIIVGLEVISPIRGHHDVPGQPAREAKQERKRMKSESKARTERERKNKNNEVQDHKETIPLT